MTRVTHVFELSEKPGKHVWGGVERHLRILLPALARRGIDVEALVLATSPGPVVAEGLDELRAGGVSVTCFERPSVRPIVRKVGGFLLQRVELWRALRRRRDRIVHLHLDMIFAPLVAAAAGCRSVMTVHADPEPWSSLRWRIWLRVISRVIDRYVGISQRACAYYRHVAGVPNERIRVIEYGMPLPAEQPVRRADFGIPEKAFVVGFVGRLSEEKNLFVLLDAVGECADTGCVLVGNGPLRGALEEHASRIGLADVRFLGAIEHASRLLPLFDVLCLPSRAEGLGLVLIEAMLRGVPCVGSRGGAIPEILGAGRYGLLFETDSSASLGEALRLARRDPALRRRLAAAALEYARVRFSVERMAEATEEVYVALERGVVAQTFAGAGPPAGADLDAAADRGHG
jgi:glycosyltransferase involved in cell wall biosynthesis